MQESFVFYASFFEAGQYLSKKDRLRLYDAIGEYGLKGTVPELTGAPMAVFCVIKPLIDANRTRRENGKTGGRPKKENKNQWFSDVEENENHGFDENEKCTNEKKPNENENVNGNENENENNNVNVNVTASEKTNASASETGSAEKDAPSLTEKKPKFPAVTFGYDKDGKFHGIDENLKNYWRNQFPGLDIEQELRNAESWLDSNRSRRKQNIKSFLTNWMIRSQEKQNSSSAGSYDKFDGTEMDEVSEEERRIFNGF